MTYRIIGIAQVYNELRKGHLERFVKHIVPLVDELVVYDDASTDGSYEYLLKNSPHVIRGARNAFADEMRHKQMLLDKALALGADFVLWLDADETLTRNAQRRLQEICGHCIENAIDAISFHELNLWRSHSWRRVDNSYDDGWFVRLWRVVPGMSFGHTAAGLHRRNYPDSIDSIEPVRDVKVIHFGFASDRSLAHKYFVYKSHGQSGWRLNRFLDESTLRLEKVPKEEFPDGLWIDDEAPKRRTFEQGLRAMEQFRPEIFVPGISIICLVYRSTAWLEFVHEQVLKHTDLDNKEFFFVANDATDAVLTHLRDNYIPHHVWNNREEQRREWYINNVYRAFNYGAKVAVGDYLLFINSDMAFTPGWFERLFEKIGARNCVTSRLVESGKMGSGQYGISMDFGRSIEQYREGDFQNYAKYVARPGVAEGGLFMPLLVRREDFGNAGGYPEGNVALGSDLFRPTIAEKGQQCITGDVALMRKLLSIGVQHQTALDSIVYHFQCGETDARPDPIPRDKGPSVVICNDWLTGRMGEKTMWGFLLESLASSVGVDMAVTGTDGTFASNARDHINKNYPHCAVIIQNATFIDSVDEKRFTIAYLQDNLRAMGRQSEQQERTLRHADLLVTNSHLTARSYPELDFEIIPIGVDSTLFRPMDKASIRRDLSFSEGTIGIFVGDFTETKGWSIIRKIVEDRRDIFWILVSKDEGTFQAENCRVYNRIPQELLARLLNCANFFILGSPVETQCLAAIEACMCDVPIIMRNTGIFADLTGEERSRVGIFGEDLGTAVNLISSRAFSPRQAMVDMKLTVEGMAGQWVALLQKAHERVNSRRALRYNAGESIVTATDHLPTVSVITPAYNRATYLVETIESVLSQDYPKIEYIALDDGSTDNTLSVLKRYDGRIIWGTHPNTGETGTVNEGFSMAHGDIVVVVNSDDPLLPGAVSTAVAFMQSHPDILVGYPDWNFIDAASRTTSNVQVREYDYKYMVSHHHCTPGPGAFIRRRAFELTGPRDPEFKYVADFEYWLRLGLYGPFARIPETLATFRVHDDSASVAAKGRAMAAEHIRLMRTFYKHRDLPQDIRRVRSEAFCWAHIIAAVAAGRARRPAAYHLLQAAVYDPVAFALGIRQYWISGISRQAGSVNSAIGRVALSLHSVLPEPLYGVLRWGWYRAVRPVLLVGLRIVERVGGAQRNRVLNRE